MTSRSATPPGPTGSSPEVPSARAESGGRLPGSWLAWLAERPPHELALRRAGFQAVLAGRRAGAGALAADLGRPVEDVRADLDRLARQGLLELDEQGRLVACWGLSLRPTAHVLRLSGSRRFTWCAVDAIGIPAALLADAEVESRCAGCGRPVRIELRAGVPVQATPDAIRIWVADVVPGRAMAGDT